MSYAFSDDSGDRKYFTIIPNYIANHSTANDQALYFQMKRHAGEKGVCFVSEKTLLKKLKIGRSALKESIKYLTEHGWITFVGIKEVETPGGKQPIKCYKVNNIWKINNDFYEGVAKTTPLKGKTGKGVSETAQRGVQNDTKGVSETAPKKIPEKKNKEEDVFFNSIPEESRRMIRDFIGKKDYSAVPCGYVDN